MHSVHADQQHTLDVIARIIVAKSGYGHADGTRKHKREQNTFPCHSDLDSM
jgi:hypothetical protein